MRVILRLTAILLPVVFISLSNLGSSVVINEIMYDPTKVSDSYGEWFELHNVGEDTLDLNEWSIRDSGRDFHELSREGGLIVPPGSYVVLGRENDPSVNGGYAPDYVYDGFTLSNSGDEILLIDAGGAVRDSVAYGGEGWPGGSGQSLEFIEGSSDNSDGANWLQASETYGDGDYGTPGRENSAAVGMGDDEDGQGVGADSPAIFLRSFPNPFSGSTTITLEGVREQAEGNFQHSRGVLPAELKVYDLRGRLVRNLWEGHLNGMVAVTWNGRDDRGVLVSPGPYLLRLTGKNAACQRKIIFRGR